MRDGQRQLVNFALLCLAIGGNGEGWKVTDAINALRLALGQHEAKDPWTSALDDDDYARLYAFVGVHAVADALDEVTQ